MHTELSIELLAHHPEALDELRSWFETEWPRWYGPGGEGSAANDLQACSQAGSLPVGVVALQAGRVCGVAALKKDSIAGYEHLTPWAATGLVHPAMRGHGIGRLLLAELEQQARELGFANIYCGTGTSHSLMQRSGWQLMENIVQEGEALGIYCKELQPSVD